MEKLFKSKAVTLVCLFTLILLLSIPFPNGPKLPPVEMQAREIINDVPNGSSFQL